MSDALWGYQVPARLCVHIWHSLPGATVHHFGARFSSAFSFPYITTRRDVHFVWFSLSEETEPSPKGRTSSQHHIPLKNGQERRWPLVSFCRCGKLLARGFACHIREESPGESA